MGTELGKLGRSLWPTKMRSSNNPSGPKVIPGNHQVRLTVDGQTYDSSLQVVMDPRAAASPEVLARQLLLGRKYLANEVSVG